MNPGRKKGCQDTPTKDYKRHHHWKCPGQEQTNKQKNPGKTWLSEILWILRVKADFHSTWMCGFFLVPRRQEGTEWWAMSSLPLRLRQSTNTGEQDLPPCFSSNLVDSLSPYNELKEKRSLTFRVSVTTEPLRTLYRQPWASLSQQRDYPKGLSSRGEDQSEKIKRQEDTSAGKKVL